MANEDEMPDGLDTSERRGMGAYNGPERRRCERGQFCTNLAEARAGTQVLAERVDIEYRALHTRLDELSERLMALPREISDQIERERRERREQIEKNLEERREEVVANRADLDAELGAGTAEFKKIAKRLKKIEGRQMLLWFLVAVAIFGDAVKIIALFWPAVGKLIG